MFSKEQIRHSCYELKINPDTIENLIYHLEKSEEINAVLIINRLTCLEDLRKEYRDKIGKDRFSYDGIDDLCRDYSIWLENKIIDLQKLLANCLLIKRG